MLYDTTNTSKIRCVQGSAVSFYISASSMLLCMFRRALCGSQSNIFAHVVYRRIIQVNMLNVDAI